jgi:hypothetical protein
MVPCPETLWRDRRIRDLPTRTGELKHLVENLNWQLYWFDRFLNGDKDATASDSP